MTTPGLPQFLAGYADAIRGERGQRQNVRRGGTIDLVGGSSALLWAALAQRDKDLFRANIVDSATGEDLERQVQRRYGVTRIPETRGTGTLVLTRVTTAGGSDTIDAGTRVRVTGAGIATVYRVTETTLCSAVDLVVPVPIEATRPGPGVAVSATAGAIAFDDSIFDPTLLPVSIVCADGTLEETPAVYVARARAAKRARRIGYRRAVEMACRAAGAANVVILAPDALGSENDQAITNVYVGDAAYATTSALIDDCYVAIDAVRVAGCDAQVLPMVIVPVDLVVVMTLWDAPSKFDLLAIRRDVVDALVSSFNTRADFWLFSVDSLAGVAFAAADGAAQEAVVFSSALPSAASFPAALPRYTLSGTSIALTIQGP